MMNRDNNLLCVIYKIFLTVELKYIKDFERNGPESPTAIFPNLIFGEGGGDVNPFVATIARYYNGNLHFFNLTRRL